MLDLEHMQEYVEVMFGGALGGGSCLCCNGVKLQAEV